MSPSSVLVTTSKALVTRSDALVTSSFLLLVAMPGAPSSFLFLVVRPGAPSSVLDRLSNTSVASDENGFGVLPTILSFGEFQVRLVKMMPFGLSSALTTMTLDDVTLLEGFDSISFTFISCCLPRLKRHVKRKASIAWAPGENTPGRVSLVRVGHRRRRFLDSAAPLCSSATGRSSSSSGSSRASASLLVASNKAPYY